MSKFKRMVATILTTLGLVAPVAAITAVPAQATSPRSIWYVQPQRDNAVWVRSDEDADTGGKIGPATPQFIAQRRQSLDPDGKDRAKPFSMHEYVSGGNIQFQDGRTASGCIIRDAPGPGVVDHGAVNPFSGEINGRQYCPELLPLTAAPAPAPQAPSVDNNPRLTGKGNWLAFGPTQSVFGFNICVNGVCSQTRVNNPNGAFVLNAPFGGTVLDGGITAPGTVPTSDALNGLVPWGGP